MYTFVIAGAARADSCEFRPILYLQHKTTIVLSEMSKHMYFMLIFARHRKFESYYVCILLHRVGFGVGVGVGGPLRGHFYDSTSCCHKEPKLDWS